MMSTERPDSNASWRETLALYLETAKARLASLVLLTTLVGYVLGANGSDVILGLIWTMLGTALTAFGANILNQLLEADRDRRMKRTCKRPLPSGRLSATRAFLWGIGSAAAGITILAVGTNLLTATLALFVVVLYVAVYTPLKIRTPLNTVVGSVVGAIPPMMGWTAATGHINIEAWILFGILFLWQIPHFLALAWMYRDDYARAGFRMLPSVDDNGALSARVALVYTCILMPICAFATMSGITGIAFLIGSLLLCTVFAVLGLDFLRQRTRTAARNLFLASIIYLPLLLGLMVADANGRIFKTFTGSQSIVTIANGDDAG